MLKEAVVLLAVQALVVSIGSMCPDRNVCEERHTCCQGPTGEYSCCPHHQGECCDDHLHCCPEHTICQMEEGNSSCVNATHSLPRTERVESRRSSLLKSLRVISASPVNMDAVVCPDKTFCPAEFSCVKLPITYGCCPIAQGIVCADGKHCCPEGLECSSDGKSCIQPREPVVAVICSDGMFECPQGASCCQSSDGVWGCCPFPRAVCCDDKEHCCPEDSTCDVKNSKCISSTNQHMPMWAKFPARLRADWEDHDRETTTEAKLETSTTQAVTAEPETTSTQPNTAAKMATQPSNIATSKDVPCNNTVACEDANTCCKTAEDEWVCCPLPKAVCCEDHFHCCPEGTTCDGAHGTCQSVQSAVPMRKKLPALALPPKENDVACDSTHACADGTTCCKDDKGEWECCPLAEAVCCEDHIHCCPKGTTCDVAHDTCQSAQGPVPMLTKLPALALPPKENDVTCDSTHACADGTTCCKTETGEWACCPLAEAVCCEDHIHCCPKGTTCDVAHDTCQSAQGPVPMLTKLPALSLPPKENDVACDSTHACADGTTCCKTETGEWACCPLAEAVCCEDHIHCCPKGTTCDVEHDTCQSAQGPVPMLTKLPALSLPPKENNVTCDSTHACADGTTCCKTETGEWACCPLAEAVCCEDHIHCCPKGTTCDVAHDTCQSAQGPVPMLTKLPALALPPKENDVACDSTHACADGTTCCKDDKGEWECCPLAEAVCCEDHIHCCPKGTTCDVAHDTCQSAQGPVPMLTKLPALSLPPKENDVACDSTHACADGTTCCKTETGEWACCPLAEAVCCEDHIHCCPKGTTCDGAHDTCQSAQGPVPMLTKLPALALPPKENDVACDSTHACADGTTCCKDDKGEWECCPLAEAVCCEDHIHCCPKGTTCDVAHDTCQSAQGPVPMLTKLPALALPPKENNVTCDSTHACADGTTCCKDDKGEWACCPLAEAVCCDDNTHCCPKGTTCDVAAQTCLSATGPVPVFTKLTATAVSPEVKEAPTSRAQCDASTSCPDHNTCCFMKEEKTWGCCPLADGLCCEDGEHCCPHGYKCDMATTTCINGDVIIPWYNKLPAQSPPSPSESVAAVTCASQSSCPSGSSCCQLSNEKLGCCPLTEAVCCSDQAHCCPQGYVCNLEAGSCQRSILFQVQMLPLIRVMEQEPEKPGNVHEVTEVKCDDAFSCVDEETCCRAEEGWGCCPAPKATCCTDKKHCCPAGYSCDDGGSCIQSTRLHKDNWQVFFSKKKRALVF